MYKGSAGKTAGSLFLAYTISFGMLFLWSIIFPPTPVLGNLFIGTAFLQAAFLFIEYLIPIHTTGILLAYSLIIASDKKRPEHTEKDFRTIVSPVMVLIIILSLGYTAVIMWLQPDVIDKINGNVNKTVIAKNFFQKAKNALSDKNYKDASDFIHYSLSIYPDWKEGHALEREIHRRLISSGSTENPESEVKATKPEIKHEELIEDQTADQLMEKAWYFFNLGNFYSSYYFSTLASKLDKTRSDAIQLASDSINKMTKNELSQADEQARDFFRKKHEGYTALLNRDYITAYYIFTDLKKSHPEDKDVDEYLTKSMKFVNLLTFFIDELNNIDAFPGTDKILFMNRQTDNFREFVFIDRMIPVKEGIYFKNIEAIKISNNGEVTSHLKAEYGKYIQANVLKGIANDKVPVSDSFINFNCIDRSDPTIRKTPVYLVKDNENTVFTNFLNLIPDIMQLRDFKLAPDPWTAISWTELLSLRLGSIFEKRGFSTRAVDSELLKRALYPFTFIIFSLLAISFGWILRSRYQTRPPIVTFFFLPAIPFIMTFLTNLYFFMNTAINGLTSFIFGFYVSFIILIVIQAIALIFSLIFIAGKISE
jgi:lipopolysaccharide export LptBFGC system permease protein LptF